MVTIGVVHNTPVRSDTQVGIESQGLTGGAAITLVGGEASSPPPEATDGELPLLTAAPGAGQDWASLGREALRKLNDMLDANADNIHSAIANFNTFTDVLAKNSDRIDGLIAGLERMTGGGAEPAKVPLYDLTAVKDFPPLTEQPSWQLVIPEPSALLALNTDKMTVKPEGAAESTDIPNAKWADAAPILLQEKILQSFENAGYSRSVSRPKDGFEAGFQLLLDIRSFSLIDGDKPVGEVAFEAKVLGPDGKIVAAKTFKGTAPADGTDAAAAAAALNAAFDQTAKELVPWTAEAVNTAPAVTPAPSEEPPADEVSPQRT